MPLQRRELLGLAGMAAAAWAAPAPAWATGIESVDLPQLELPEAVAAIKARQQGVLDDAEKVFQESGADEGAVILRCTRAADWRKPGVARS